MNTHSFFNEVMELSLKTSINIKRFFSTLGRLEFRLSIWETNWDKLLFNSRKSILELSSTKLKRVLILFVIELGLSILVTSIILFFININVSLRLFILIFRLSCELLGLFKILLEIKFIESFKRVSLLFISNNILSIEFILLFWISIMFRISS